MGTRHMKEKRVCLFPNSKEQKTRGKTVTPFFSHIVFFPLSTCPLTLHIINNIALCNSFQMPFLVCVFMRSIERDEKLQTTSNALSVKD